MHVGIGLPSYAFYTGSLSAGVISSPDTGPVVDTVPFTVTLDGWTYAIDKEQYRFGVLDTFRDGVVANDEPNDSLFNARGAWSRYRTSWHHGQDQPIADLVVDADPYRYRDSYGFDVWNRQELRLLPRARLDDDVTIDDGSPILARSGAYLFIANNDGLLRTNTLVTWNSMTISGDTINDLASDGHDLYIATDDAANGLVKLVGTNTTPTNFVTPVTGPCHKVAFVGNRLLVGKANVISAVAAAGTLTTIETHYQPEFRWTAVFAIGSRIYIGGFAGVKSELYALTTDGSGNLVTSQEAAPLPIGEQLLTALSYGGAVLLGTSAGVRFATLGADGTLSYGPLIATPGAVHAICAEGPFAWVTWNDATTHPADERGVGRLDLTAFVDVLQPAFASDVYAADSAGDVTGVERFDDATVYLVGDTGLYVARDDGDWDEGGVDLARTAQLRSGRMFFGTIEPKGLAELEVLFAELPADVSIAVRVLDADGALVGIGSQSIAGTTSLRIQLNGAQVREVTVEISVVNAGDAPLEIRSWRLRAYPAPPQTLQWIVPIMTAEHVAVNSGESATMSQVPRDVLDRVEALHRSRRLVSYSEGTRSWRVRVEAFEGRARRWSDDGATPTGVVAVQLIGN